MLTIASAERNSSKLKLNLI